MVIKYDKNKNCIRTNSALLCQITLIERYVLDYNQTKIQTTVSMTIFTQYFVDQLPSNAKFCSVCGVKRLH